TPFALTVGDADNIDRFDAYRIHEILCRDGFTEKNFNEKLAYVTKRITKLRELKDMPVGTSAAKELWTSRLDYYIGFYEKLLRQLENSKSINE
ncbi:MAG: HD domain-containing protein, partial [Clostridia bacterium]|nr:HD domain-containing protein [Clostridia bacterium]